MFNLILAILFSAIIPVLLKYSHHRKVADEVVLTFNYLVAVIMSICFTLFKFRQYTLLINDTQQLYILILIGIMTGLMFYGAFFYYQKSVKENGVSLSIAVGKMGIIIPMVLSLIIWRELPTILQWIGISISMLAIGLINIHPSDFKKTSIKTSLLLFFIIGGLGDFFNKLFETSVGAEYKDLFLVVVFTTALIASLINTLRHKNITMAGVLYGFAIGLPNMLTALFLINSLSVMNATVVFPTYSGGAIMLSMLWSLFAFHEKLTKKEGISIILILIALIIVNY